MIILITKTFTEKKKKKISKRNNSQDWKEKLKEAVTTETNASKSNEGGNGAKKYRPRPNKKKDARLAKLHEDIGGVQRDIDILNAERELRETKDKLNYLSHPVPTVVPKPEDTRDRFEKFRDRAKEKVKSKISDPKFKKGAKIAGLATLGTAATAGLIAGGIKLKKKIDQERSNKKIKEQIAENEE